MLSWEAGLVIFESSACGYDDQRILSGKRDKIDPESSAELDPPLTTHRDWLWFAPFVCSPAVLANGIWVISAGPFTYDWTLEAEPNAAGCVPVAQNRVIHEVRFPAHGGYMVALRNFPNLGTDSHLLTTTSQRARASHGRGKPLETGLISPVQVKG